MPQFNVYFRDPQNPKKAGAPVAYEGDSPEALVQQIMVHEGQTPVGIEPIGAPQGAPQASQAAPQAPLPSGTAPPLNGAVPTPPAGSPEQGDPNDSRAALLGTIGQVALPLLGRALMGREGGMLGAALGMGGGLAGSALGRKGLPTRGDVAGTAMGEALPFLGRGLARAGRLPEAGAALARGTSGAAQRAGIPLAASQRFPQAVEAGLIKAGTEVPESLVARQEAAAGQAIVNESRAALKAIPENPVRSAHQLLSGLKGFASSLGDVERAAFERSLATIDPKLNLDKLSVGGLRTMVARNPLAVKEMFRIAQAAGRGVAEAPETTTARLWLTDAIHGSTKVPLGTGQFRSGRAMFDLDGRAFKDIWRSLKPADQAAFGPVAKNLEHLVRVIDTFPAADRSRIAMPWFKTVLHKNLGLPLALGAFSAGELGAGHILQGFSEHPFMTAGAAATTATLLASAKGSKFLMSRFLASDAGSRWVAAGLAAQARGVPEMLIVEGLTRMAGRNMQAGRPQAGPSAMPGLPPLGPNTALAQ